MMEKRSIDLKSEQTRNLLKEIPNSLLRASNWGIILFIVIIFLYLFIIPYQKYTPISVVLYNDPAPIIVKSKSDGYFYKKSNVKKISINSEIGSVVQNNGLIDIYLAEYSGELLLNCEDGDYMMKGDIIYVIFPCQSYRIKAIGYYEGLHEICPLQQGQKVLMKIDPILGLPIESETGYISKIYPIPDIDSLKGMYIHKIEIETLGQPKITDLKNKSLLHSWRVDGEVIMPKSTLLDFLFNIL